MGQNQNLVKPSLKTKSRVNFLHFFNLKMFRYSLFKQLKAVSSYVLMILMFIATFGCLLMLLGTKNHGNTMEATDNVIVFKFMFFIIYFPFFTMLIAFKSVQMIRDEIDDGTLLIFNSMPYTRTRMIVEKWLSVQVVCLFYSTIILLLPTSLGYMIAKISDSTDSVLNFKILFSLINTTFLTSFILQLLLTTFAILLSVALSGKATTGLVSMFGSLAFIGPVLTLILSTAYNQTSNTYSTMNYYEKAVRESGLKKYFNDPDTKQYFEFNSWAENTKSISEVQRDSFYFNKLFDVKSNDLEAIIAKYQQNNSNLLSQVDADLKPFKDDGIKINGNILTTNSTVKVENAKALYNEVEWEKNQPLSLTSYVKKEYDDIVLFKNAKLEEIRKILNSKYFSINYNIEERNHLFNFYFEELSDAKTSSNQSLNKMANNLLDMIENGEVGISTKKDGFLRLNNLFINNPQYYAFINFIQKLKDIATNFGIIGSTVLPNNNTDSNLSELNQQLEEINKYNKTFKINNYLNIWAQWYMMWNGDHRPQKGTSSFFLVPNAKANFAISKQPRTFLKQDPSSAGQASLINFDENFINADYSSIKPIVNMTGLYATYVCLSLILSAVTIYVVIRKDFV